MDKANLFEFFKIQLLSFDTLEDIFQLEKGKPIYQVCHMQRHGFPNPLIIEADPFLFVYHNRLFLFYERKQLHTPGSIMMVSTSDLQHWSKPVEVLREDFHLSFPWVFEREGHVYMLPEAGGSRSVRMYEAKDDGLAEFSYCATILTEPEEAPITMHYGDSCIFEKDQVFYLFTQLQYQDHINTLELYTSDHLMGPYRSHVMSPVQHSQQLGRNAGCILSLGGKIYRFSQDCTAFYGDNVHVSQIDTLSSTDYREHLVKESILPCHLPFYQEGGHHFNAVRFLDQWIVSTDAKEYHPLWGVRILNKIKSFMRQ